MKIFLIAILVAGEAFAQPATVQVNGPVYDQFGALYSGSVTIMLSIPGITAAASTTVLSEPKTISIKNGVLSVQLVPNTGSTPVSTAYIFAFGNGESKTCTVPASGPVTIADVCTNNIPPSGSTFSVGPAQISPGTNGQVLCTTGGVAAWGVCGGVAGAWGSITGTLSSQADLVTALGLRLAAALNLSDLADKPTSRVNLGLGTAATQDAGAFDAAGAAAAAQAASDPAGSASTAQAAAIAASAAALTAYAGTANVATLGTITEGIWHGAAIGLDYLPTIPSTKTSGFAAVATSGLYSDLTGTPTLAANTTAASHQFFAAYNSTTGAFTKAQPVIGDISGAATVAGTGAYSDLTGKPTITRTMQIPLGGFNNAAGGQYPAFGTDGTGITSNSAWSGYLFAPKFSSSGAPQIQFSFRVPSDWDSASATGLLLTAADTAFVGGGNIKFATTNRCIASGTSISTTPPYTYAANTGTVLLNYGATTDTAITPLTMTGCSGNSLMVVSLNRDNTVTSNVAAAVPLISVALSYSAH